MDISKVPRFLLPTVYF